MRRSAARGKELPEQLRTALEIQAGQREVAPTDKEKYNELKSYHINQRSEGIDLNCLSGALMATQTLQMQTFVSEPFLVLNDQGGNRMDITEDVTATLRAGMGGNLPIVLGSGQSGASVCENLCPTITSAAGTSGNNQPILFENHGRDCRYKGPLDVSPTLAATGGMGGNNLPLVANQNSYCIAGNIIDRQVQNGGNGLGCQEDISYTLTSSDRHAVYRPEPYQAVVGALCSGDEKGIGNQYVSQDKCIVDPTVFGQSSFANYKEGCTTLRAEGGDNGGGSENLAVAHNLVRRLTPLECERLQGFPDGWTAIEGARDAPRYKSLGNSIAVPCVDFILRGVATALRKIYETPYQEGSEKECISTPTT